jgi:2-polyprenyl-3-methyl-5-hydroxy-6-metoxy-1,4-benzoquinol methylase
MHKNSILYKYLNNIYEDAYTYNTSNILKLLERNPKATVLDVGCSDGQKTVIFNSKINSNTIIGIDDVPKRVNSAKKKNLIIKNSNLENKWPISNNSIDVIVSNQVIEHIIDTDSFIQETLRVLKPNGYCVISTENLSSWHNIFALILGFQDFSHHTIKKTHINNPYSLHFGEKTLSWTKKDNSGADDSKHPHTKIFTLRSLVKSFEAYGFKFEKFLGSGYHPLFNPFSKIASTLDPYHAHFIAIKMRKLT